jgi:hypothetical protein
MFVIYYKCQMQFVPELIVCRDRRVEIQNVGERVSLSISNLTELLKGKFMISRDICYFLWTIDHGTDLICYVHYCRVSRISSQKYRLLFRRCLDSSSYAHPDH